MRKRIRKRVSLDALAREEVLEDATRLGNLGVLFRGKLGPLEASSVQKRNTRVGEDRRCGVGNPSIPPPSSKCTCVPLYKLLELMTPHASLRSLWGVTSHRPILSSCTTARRDTIRYEAQRQTIPDRITRGILLFLGFFPFFLFQRFSLCLRCSAIQKNMHSYCHCVFLICHL